VLEIEEQREACIT